MNNQGKEKKIVDKISLAKLGYYFNEQEVNEEI